MIKKKTIKKKVSNKSTVKKKKKLPISNFQKECIYKFDTYFRKVFQEMEQIRALVHAHSIGAQNVYNEFLKIKEKLNEFEKNFSRFGIK